MSRQYAIDVIEDLYLEGEHDYIFLEQIVGLIRYDCRDDLRGRSEAEVRQGSIDLIDFLIGSGDFCLALGNERRKGGVDFRIYKGDRLKLIDTALNSTFGADFQYRIVLQKTRQGVSAPSVPEQIIDLLA